MLARQTYWVFLLLNSFHWHFKSYSNMRIDFLLLLYITCLNSEKNSLGWMIDTYQFTSNNLRRKETKWNVFNNGLEETCTKKYKWFFFLSLWLLPQNVLKFWKRRQTSKFLEYLILHRNDNTWRKNLLLFHKRHLFNTCVLKLN